MSGSNVAQYQQWATAAAQKYGVPTQLFLAQIGQESGWNASAAGSVTSGGTPVGLGQFMPATAAQFHINPLDPQQSLDAAAQYDAQLYQQTGSWLTALQKYGTLPTSNLTASQSSVASLATAADGGSAPANTGVNVGATGGTAAAPGATSSTATGGGLINSVWEIVSRGALLFAGFGMVMLALFALFIDSKTVQTTLKHVPLPLA